MWRAEERFEAAGEEMERHLSLGSAELLRREGAPARSGSLFDADRLFTPGRVAPDEDGALMICCNVLVPKVTACVCLTLVLAC